MTKKNYCEKHNRAFEELWPNNLLCEQCFVDSFEAHLVFHGQCPSGKNSVIVTRTGKRFPSKRFANWREAVLDELRWKKKAYSGPVHVVVKYWASDNRRRDVPGLIDACWHVLEKAGVVTDDTHLGGKGKNLIFQNMGVDKDNPRVEIHIK